MLLLVNREPSLWRYSESAQGIINNSLVSPIDHSDCAFTKTIALTE
jgi:hypothetical protein